jgi:hypothetical protein
MSSWGIFNSKDEGHNFDFLGYKAYATGPIVVNSKGDIFIGNLGALGTTNDIFRSTDGGKTWENKTTGAATVNAIVINSKDVLFIEPGYRSTDNGETWQDLGLECSFLAINNEDHVFAFRDGTIYRSTDDGVSWEKQLSVDCDPTFMEREGRILFNNKTKTAAYSILPRNLDSCCFITTDNGRSWQLSKTLSLTSSSNTAVDSLYCWVKAGSRGIARSCDNGLTWQYLDTTGLKHKEFGPIGVSPDGHIYVFGSTGGLYRSRDAFVGTPGEDFLNRKIFISSHPNPFRQSTTIEFYIYFEDIITIALYNTIGEKVKTMVDNEFYFQGFNKVEVPTDGLPSGIYFCRLESKRLRETLKIIKVD